MQRGLTSAGRTWLLDVTNVSVTPYTYSEEFTGNEAVLSRDNLKIAFRVHTVWRMDDTKIPLLMELFVRGLSRGGPARVRGGTTLTAGDSRFFRRPAMGRAFPVGSLAALAGDLPSKLGAHGGEPFTFSRVRIHH